MTSFLLPNFFCDRCLATHCIDRNYTSLEHESIEEFGYGCNLIRFLSRPQLSKYDVIFGCKSRDNMRRLFPMKRDAGIAYRFAIDCNDPLNIFCERLNPLDKAFFKALGIYKSEKPPNGVMRRNTAETEAN